jgi:hypothetical protein
MLRRYFATAATVAVTSGMLLAAGPAASAATAAPGPVAPPAACVTSAVITVDSFDFSPAQVAPGQSSTANLVTTNCTGVAQQTEQTWVGQYVSTSTTGLPSGCPVIDPLARSVDYTPYQEVLTSGSYLALSGCTANELKVTVRISGSNGALINEATAILQIQQ